MLVAMVHELYRSGLAETTFEKASLLFFGDSILKDIQCYFFY